MELARLALLFFCTLSAAEPPQRRLYSGDPLATYYLHPWMVFIIRSFMLVRNILGGWRGEVSFWQAGGWSIVSATVTCSESVVGL